MADAASTMSTYLVFVEQLRHRAMQWAMAAAPVSGFEQAENDAVHIVGDGMALVPLEEVMREPGQAASRFAQHRASTGMPLYDQDAQWRLCPLSKREAFLQLVDAGATVRDKLRHSGHREQILQDAAAIAPADLEAASTPLSAAVEYLQAWPDLGQLSSPHWLVIAFRRRTN